jgi:uncharacterized membrane protein SpoIIM required for sporulation
MDIDRFIATHRDSWERLDELTRRAARNPRRLTGAEVEELLAGYRQAATHLSYARTYLADPGLVGRLTLLVARAGAVVYGTRPATLRAAWRFVTETFPAAVWHLRRFVAIATLWCLAVGLAVGTWMARSPAALDAAAPAALREAYVEEDFAAYYSSRPSAEFAGRVFTNNLGVGILAFAGGLTLGLLTVAILTVNAANIGFAAGLFAAAGQAARFWGLVLPHGLLELTAVFIAGGTGLSVGWAAIEPGERTRREALADEARRAVAVVLGLAGVFGAAGAIEGFVTGSTLPTTARIGIGVTAEAAFLAYASVLGRRAAARGVTGDLSP